jgi:hypothetical protein
MERNRRSAANVRFFSNKETQPTNNATKNHHYNEQRSQIKEYLSTMSSSRPCLWAQLVTIEGQNIGNIVKITPIPEDISDVKNEFFKLKQTSLKHCDAAELNIKHEGMELGSREICSDMFDVNKQIDLIVEAPQGKSDLEIFVLMTLLVSWMFHTKYRTLFDL